MKDLTEILGFERVMWQTSGQLHKLKSQYQE